MCVGGGGVCVQLKKNSRKFAFGLETVERVILNGFHVAVGAKGSFTIICKGADSKKGGT